ncbi:MAG TPA: metallophosphoesterase [bacterium]|nr:metallophosphoesterase [bacterium]
MFNLFKRAKFYTGLGLLLLPALALSFATQARAGAYREDFESLTAGASLSGQAGWTAESFVTVEEGTSHAGKKALRITPTPAAGRAFQRTLEWDAGWKEVWVDAYLRTPKSPQLAMLEVQKGGQMMAAGGPGGPGEAGSGFVFRSSRGQNIGWPRMYERASNIYTGESSQLKPETWVRLTMRLDLEKKEFEVYRNGKCVFSEMEMAKALPAAGEFTLRLTTSPIKAEASPADFTFYVDDLYLGPEKPAGIEPAQVVPVRPKGTLARVVVVGDTQISAGEAKTRGDIYGTLGPIITAVNRLEPDLVLFVGDLVNIGGDPATHKEQAAILYPVWTEEMKRLKAPYYTTPGNHDPHALYKQYIRPEVDYSVEKNGITFIAFSSSAPENPDDWSHNGKVSPEQLAWLEKEMAKAAAKKNRIVTFTHITSHPNQHPLVGWYIREGGPELRALYDRYGVFAEFSGHMHRWLANWKENKTWYIVAPGTMGGGYVAGAGLAVYDILPDKAFQYEKPTRMPYFNSWGQWAKPELD